MKNDELEEMLNRIAKKQPELKDECMSCIELLEYIKTLPEELPEVAYPDNDIPF